MPCRTAQLGFLVPLDVIVRRVVGVGPNIGWVQIRADRRNENGLRKKTRLEERLRSRDKVSKLLDRHREHHPVFASGKTAQDADDLLRLAGNDNAPATAASDPTFLIAECQQSFRCGT